MRSNHWYIKIFTINITAKYYFEITTMEDQRSDWIQIKWFKYITNGTKHLNDIQRVAQRVLRTCYLLLTTQRLKQSSSCPVNHSWPHYVAPHMSDNDIRINIMTNSILLTFTINIPSTSCLIYNTWEHFVYKSLFHLTHHGRR